LQVIKNAIYRILLFTMMVVGGCFGGMSFASYYTSDPRDEILWFGTKLGIGIALGAYLIVLLVGNSPFEEALTRRYDEPEARESAPQSSDDEPQHHSPSEA